MRIAMILRPDAERIFGGDTVVMRKLGSVYRARGVEVAVDSLQELPPASEFDLLHIFTITPMEHIRSMMAWAESGELPVVISPLYYASLRSWFERAAGRSPRWRTLAKVLGRGRAWFVFRTWQESRLPLNPAWQTGRAALESARSVAAGSTWENRYIAEHFRLGRKTRQRMRVSPLGIDAGLYGRSVSPQDIAAFCARCAFEPGYVVEVARIEEKKNQHAVIEALYDQPVSLVFVGPSPDDAGDYAVRCRELGLRRGNVHFLGWLPEADLPLLYAGAGAHILPSWVELPGLSSLEAAACGCRVISTEISGLKELLGTQAWYCDPFDVASIRSAVKTALAAPAPAGLRDRVLDTMSWERAAQANLALYEQVLKS